MRGHLITDSLQMLGHSSSKSEVASFSFILHFIIQYIMVIHYTIQSSLIRLLWNGCFDSIMIQSSVKGQETPDKILLTPSSDRKRGTVNYWKLYFYLKQVSFLVCWRMETRFSGINWRVDKHLKRYCSTLYIFKTNEKVEKLTVGYKMW